MQRKLYYGLNGLINNTDHVAFYWWLVPTSYSSMCATFVQNSLLLCCFVCLIGFTPFSTLIRSCLGGKNKNSFFTRIEIAS